MCFFDFGIKFKGSQNITVINSSWKNSLMLYCYLPRSSWPRSVRGCRPWSVLMVTSSAPWELMSLAAPSLMSACRLERLVPWCVQLTLLRCAMMAPCSATWGRMTTVARSLKPACPMARPAPWSVPPTPWWRVLTVTWSAPWELTPTDAPSLTCVCPLERPVLHSKFTFTNIVK